MAQHLASLVICLVSSPNRRPEPFCGCWYKRTSGRLPSPFKPLTSWQTASTIQKFDVWWKLQSHSGRFKRPKETEYFFCHRNTGWR
jgi:hypothetical protein